jgi:hypothetical protein
MVGELVWYESQLGILTLINNYKELRMKERILKVLMFNSILLAVSFTVIIIFMGGRMEEVLAVAGIGVFVVFVTSGLQYILIAEWNPMYLFKKSGK